MTDRTEMPVALTGLSVAVVDDDARVRDVVELYLSALDCDIRTFADPTECRELLAERPADILITDLEMPGLSGIELLTAVKKQSPTTETVVITGHADKASAIRALRAGAFDFLEKPVDKDELLETVRRTMRYREALADRDRMAKRLSVVSERESKLWGIDAFVGESEAIREVLGKIRMLQKATGTSVLITGESGTGKELVARAIHFGSARRSQPFIPVNCSALPPELAESALFGHKRGAFTGATADKRGCFDEADGGTVFLDEVGDAPLAIQAKLLRVLEDGVVVAVGMNTGREVDVRVIAATNASLDEKMEAGGFRADLFYRLAAYAIEIPPLRERSEDVPLLVRHFIRTLASEMGLPDPRIDDGALVEFTRHAYPGNVRELRNMVERALIESGGERIMGRHVTTPRGAGRGLGPAASLKPARTPLAVDALPLNLREAERLLVGRALAEADGNMSAAARLLGINRTKLYRMVAALDAEQTGVDGSR